MSGGPGRGSENRAGRVEVVPAAGFADEPGPLVPGLQVAAIMPGAARDRPEDEEVAATREPGRRLIASNRRARHDYTILRTYEAGIVLIGNEVKSLRAGHVSLAGAFAQEDDGELVLHGLHISEHAYGRHGTGAPQPRRTRKLLLHRSEIDKIIGRLGDTGVTLVPLSLYVQDGWVKVEIALARGRRSFDKRQAIAQRDADREIARELSDRLRSRRRRARGSS
jgi:SsrA-binding protein